MAQGVIHQHKGQHGFGNWRRADADTGIVPAFGGHLDRIAVNVDRAPWLRNRRGGLDPVSYTHLTLPTIYSV